MSNPKLVALIATHGRVSLLTNRSIPSVLSQIRRPDKLIVVEDGDSEATKSQVLDLAPGTIFLRNRRTSGLSGTLNTGLAFLIKNVDDPRNYFVAFLDDDDAWTPKHLESVEASITKNTELVATPLLRIESEQKSCKIFPPKVLSADLFMAGNPGVQGSNLIFRLDVLLEVGGFNEALQSCTDRDLLIRYCRRSQLQYVATSNVTMHHFACSDRQRLSLRGSSTKLSGLAMFDKIHGPLMSDEIRQKHLKRSEKLFGWKPIKHNEQCVNAGSSKPNVGALLYDKETIPPLIVGIISDNRRVSSLSLLLDDFIRLMQEEELYSLDILLLENRLDEEDGGSFAEMVSQKRNQLRIRVVDHNTLHNLASEYKWFANTRRSNGRLTISEARTALQACIYHMMLEHPGSVAWVLDDDMRLDPIISRDTGLERCYLQLGLALCRMKAQGADVYVGACTGSPPVPAIASVRGQLADLIWNIRVISQRDSSALIPEASQRNRSLRTQRRDYYYDLSEKETDRHETPFALEPEYPNETCGEALKRLLTMIPRILAGESPLRPLVLEEDDLNNFDEKSTILRGGSTFILNPEVLADIPNISPTISGRPIRRSDMVWALLQGFRHKRTILSLPVAVRHDRSTFSAYNICHMDIIDDICGYAFYTALSEAGEELTKLEPLFLEYTKKRLLTLCLSFYRIRGLAKEILCWAENYDDSMEMSQTLTSQAKQVLEMFSVENYVVIESAVSSFDLGDIRNFILELDANIVHYSDSVRRFSTIPKLLVNERANTACASVGQKKIIKVLGQGSEGVTFTDGKIIWKLFDRWTQERTKAGVAALSSLHDRIYLGATLTKFSSFKQTSLGWLLEVPYEASATWPGGGYGSDLVELITDLFQAGLAHRNLHPKNIRVINGTLRLIDYGADLVHLDDPNAESLEFLRMCRRAWLCWRWWWRKDLDSLMRSSIYDGAMPELTGSENFIRAVREKIGVVDRKDPLIDRAENLAPKTILDYGAGKGRQASYFTTLGANVVVWDPEPSANRLLHELSNNKIRCAETADEAVALGPFDLVVCRQVCCLVNETDFHDLLNNLRLGVSAEGRVLISICHPAYAWRSHTAESVPLSEPDGELASIWTKKVNSTGRILREYHRTERYYRRCLMRAGFKIVGRYERQCIEFKRFEKISDMLIYELAPTTRPQVSLLIKACAMDYENLIPQVRHILSSLEDPGAFAEIVLSLDTFQGDFLRAYSKGDFSALMRSAQKLLLEGAIDKIVTTPTSDKELSRLNMRWFGLNSPASHTTAQASIATILTGFAACTNEWVLHVDFDAMISRTNNEQDPLTEMLQAMQEDASAISAAFPIAHRTPKLWTVSDGARPWRVESVMGLVNLNRLYSILPLPNHESSGAPALSWHRAMDQAVLLGRGSSLRGGGAVAFRIHPPNAVKQDAYAWELIRSSVARGIVPSGQYEKAELFGSKADWCQSERKERFIFVICGRNVVPERFRRCWESILQQDRDCWGAIIIDDDSKTWIADENKQIVATDMHRVTYIANQQRLGLLVNMIHAVRHICCSPEQVIITLDADDCLIGYEVLDILVDTYNKGADVTVGSMLRTDKSTDYKVCFDNLHSNRGGNVWQHLRSFRKYLFDAISDEDFYVNGNYPELATDWVFMLPIVKMAKQPFWIKKTIYLHEPTTKRDQASRLEREFIVSQLMQRVPDE